MMHVTNGVLTDPDLLTPRLVFPRDMTAFTPSFTLQNAVESIEVEEGNPCYVARGNCLIDIRTGRLVLGCKNSVIPQDNSVTEIGEYAFCGCQELTAVHLPPTVRAVGRMAFACTSLQSVDVPLSVTFIDTLCFALNPSLREVSFHDDLRGIGAAVFGTREELESRLTHSRPLPDCLTNRLTVRLPRLSRADRLRHYAERFHIDAFVRDDI